MISAINTSVSGVRGFQRKLDVTANNVTNVKTDEFKKQRALLKEGNHGGVQIEIDEVDTPGYNRETVLNGDVIETESSNVDLTEELTETIPTQAGYEANVKVIQTENEMLGTLLDTVG